MGKHIKKSPKRLSNKINRSLTAVAAVGFVLSATTGSAIAAPIADGAKDIERSSSSIAALETQVETKKASVLAPAVIAPVTASATAKLSFSKSVVKTVPAPKKEEPKPAPVAEVKLAEAEVVTAAPAPAPAIKVAPAVTNVAVAPAAPAQAAPTASAPASSKGAAILAAARAQIGVNQDCTMLVTNSLKSVGINFHDWPAGYLSLGTVVSAADAQPGDLIYYVDGGGGMAHIAVKSEGNNRAIHGGFNGNQTIEFSANVGSGPIYIRVR